MVLGVSVSMLCFSFGTFTVHTKFCCTHHSSQDKQWTIFGYVSQTFCFKTQTMDNILNLLQIQRIAETFLDFASSMITTIPNFACPRTTINTHIFLVVYIIYPLSHCLSCYRLDDISQRQQPDLTTYVLNSNAGHAFTESFASPSGQDYARMTVSSMAHFRTLMKRLAHYRIQCVQCLLQVLPRTFFSVWYVCLSEEWPQSLANSRSN